MVMFKCTVSDGGVLDRLLLKSVSYILLEILVHGKSDKNMRITGTRIKFLSKYGFEGFVLTKL